MDTAPKKLCYSVQISRKTTPLRLDKFVAAHLATYSRAQIQKFIQNKCVSVSGKIVADCAYQVKHPEIIEIEITPEFLVHDPKKPQPQIKPLKVVFEDEYLLIVDKPYGLSVHPAPGHSHETLVDYLIQHCGDSLSDLAGFERRGIVHRLDKDTSGLMAIAKDNKTHSLLSKQLAAREIERKYIALAYGVPSIYCGKIEASIARSNKNRTKMTIAIEGGKTAITHYKILKTYNNILSLLECKLETGRTHQIRLHLSFKGHPVVGDKDYMMSRNFNLSSLSHDMQWLIKRFHRQALHAYKLQFIHPITGEEYFYESRPPLDMAEILEELANIDCRVY